MLALGLSQKQIACNQGSGAKGRRHAHCRVPMRSLRSARVSIIDFRSRPGSQGIADGRLPMKIIADAFAALSTGLRLSVSDWPGTPAGLDPPTTVAVRRQRLGPAHLCGSRCVRRQVFDPSPRSKNTKTKPKIATSPLESIEMSKDKAKNKAKQTDSAKPQKATDVNVEVL
jgi:hypothetical protein